jgi:hypothetical protein
VVDALQGFDRGVLVAVADAYFGVVVSEILRRALGACGDEDPLVVGGAVADFGEEVVDLALHGADLYGWIGEAGGADDLLYDYASGLGEFVSVNWVAELIEANTSPCRASWKRY